MKEREGVNLVRPLSFSLSPHFRNRQLTQDGFCTGRGYSEQYTDLA